ncbi:hypothetical protein [Dyella subtropica]|nr:hypothetical protein [Dyella subtropica]
MAGDFTMETIMPYVLDNPALPSRFHRDALLRVCDERPMHGKGFS